MTKKITEPELRDYVSNGAVTTLAIIRSDSSYRVMVGLNWKEGEYTLYSQRNQPRKWVSLDRLLKYLTELAPEIRMITLQL